MDMSSSKICQITWTVILVESLILNLYLFKAVSSECATSIGNINQTFVKLPETTTEHVFVNLTIRDEKWKFYIEEINHHRTINTEWKQIFDERFTFYTNSTELLLMTTQSLDKELLYNMTGEDISIITLALECEDVNASQVINLQLLVLIESEDEYPPCFTGAPYHISVPENLPVGSHVYDLGKHVTDEDIPRDTQFTYAVEGFADNSTDGRLKFDIPDGSTGTVVLQEALDYESMVQAGLTYYILRVSVTDSGGLTSNTTINITVTDADDLRPVFINPGCNATGCDAISYRAITTAFYRGPVSVEPSITARDGDTLNYTILLSLENQKDGYGSSFRIDPVTGELQQIGDVFKSGILLVKALENSTNHRQAIASVLVILSDTFNKTISSNGTTLQSTPDGFALDLKMILIIACSALVVVIIGLIVGLCIQHRRYFKSTRPIRSLAYLYVRSFKRRKPKDNEDANNDINEQDGTSKEETEMSDSVNRNNKTQGNWNENSAAVKTVANVHTEESYSDIKDVGINTSDRQDRDLASGAVSESHSDHIVYRGLASDAGSESHSDHIVYRDLSPPNSDYSDNDEVHSEINYVSNHVDDTRIIPSNTNSSTARNSITGTDNYIYANVNKDETDGHCEQYTIEYTDSDGEVFV